MGRESLKIADVRKHGSLPPGGSGRRYGRVAGPSPGRFAHRPARRPVRHHLTVMTLYMPALKCPGRLHTNT